jgi:hypothetical protein
MTSGAVPGEPPPNERRLAASTWAISVARVSYRVSTPPHGRSVRAKLAIAAIPLCAALILGGCSSSSPKAAIQTTSTTAAPPTTEPTGPAEMALSAYRAMWADMVIASRTSNYRSPLLPQHASGAALSVLVQGLAKNQLEGIVTRGIPSIQPQVTSLPQNANPLQATITDCINDAHWLEYKTNGQLLNKIPGGRHATTAVIVDSQNNWKVTQLKVQAVGTC